MKPFPLLPLLLLAFAMQTFAQGPLNTKVSVDFRNADITTIVNKLEQQADVEFYFNIIQFNNVSFSANGNGISIREILDRLFAGSDFSYAVYQDRYIILTKGRHIYSSRTYAPQSDGQLHAKPDDSVQRASNASKLYVIGIPNAATNGKRYTLAGYVRDEKTGEPIVGASLQIDKSLIRSVTDDYGYYRIEVPSGKHVFQVQSSGMDDLNITIALHDNGKLDFELKGRMTTLKNVVISREKLSNVRAAQMGAQRIDIQTIRQVPVVLGETDVLKVVTTLPGVKTVGEASTGLNVRGGSSDQNLLLFNDVTVYNPSHFFGMFSAFNPEVVKDVVLYKSSMPARYGGRLSSVVDISSKEGNKKELSGNAGVGLMTGRIMLEGPIVKERTSFIVAGRSTYADWLLKKLPKEYKNSKASFYDINGLLSHRINKNNNLFFTAYASSDAFNLNSDTSYNYRNLSASLKWKHDFNNKLNMIVTSGWSSYQYGVESEELSVSAFRLKFDLQQADFKTHFIKYVNSSHTLDFGVSGILYQLNPGTFMPATPSSLVTYDKVQTERGLESAVYINDSWNIGNNTSIEAGIRYSVFNVIGPREIHTYAKDEPRSDDNVTGTVNYERGKFIKTYGGPEYRLSLRQSINNNLSMKLSYNTQRQYIHMISNTAAMSPTDIWKLSDPHIQPQSGTQYSFGLYTNVISNTVEISVEGYYKQINNFLDYKSGASLVMNHHIETDVINTKGTSYGAELLIKKNTGKLNGWMSYTYSKILLKQDDAIAGELINNGKEYPANYDKPHDFTIIANYRVNHRISFSANSIYNTGRPITVPVGRIYYSNSYRTLFGPRNAHRIPDYFRMDISLNVNGNYKLKQKTHSSWTFGVYNVTARKNPFSIYYVSENGVINGYKLSIFGTAIPFVSYNIKF